MAYPRGRFGGAKEASTTTTTDTKRRSNPAGIIIGILIVGIGLIALLNAIGFVNTDQSTSSFEGVAILEFELDNASVTVSAGDTVVVEKDIRTGWWGGSATEEQNGDVLRVRLDCPNLFGFGCGGSYEITVPEDVEVRGDTGNGAIALTALTSDVDVRTSNGAIRLDDLVGSVSARTSNGAIEGAGLASSSVIADTSNGPIVLTFESSPDTVEARTSNGRVEIYLPDDGPAYAVDANTSNGTVESAIRTDPAGTARIDVNTSNGDVVIGYR